MNRNIVVLGGGPAGVIAALEARKRDNEAIVTLVTEERCEPYEKPPLSKAVLLKKAEPEDALIAGTDGLSGQGVVVVQGTRGIDIDRDGRVLATTCGLFPYDALILATGSLMRQLPALPLGMANIHYLRTETDARALRRALVGGSSLLIVGAGLIGLEVAASATELSLAVTVVEAAPRVMMRACDEEVGARVQAEHKRRGVDVRLGVSVTAAKTLDDGRLEIGTTTGDVLVADHVVVGVGVIPNDGLAAAAGLAVDDGILVDAECRTSDPAIFAAGDCTRFPGPSGLVRLENWKHAMDQGGVAGQNAAGASEVYMPTPSFWSDQYDLNIQGVGWRTPHSNRVTRHLSGDSLCVFELVGNRISHATGINARRDISVARRLIERRVSVDPELLANAEQPLAALLKARL